jgi:hypothetical protein
MKKHGQYLTHSLTRELAGTHAHSRPRSENKAAINTEKSININISHKNEITRSNIGGILKKILQGIVITGVTLFVKFLTPFNNVIITAGLHG